MSLCHLYINNQCVFKNNFEVNQSFLEHNCEGNTRNCSFIPKESKTQSGTTSSEKPISFKIKDSTVYIYKVNNPYLVKADCIIYPANSLLHVLEPTLLKMSKKQLNENIIKNKMVKRTRDVKMGYAYHFEVPSDWHLKQKHFINAVVAGESQLVNCADIQSAMMKSCIIADQLECNTALLIPCDNGTYDVENAIQHQFFALFSLMSTQKLNHLKKIFICMSDEMTKEISLEFANRIFRGPHESRNATNATSNSK